MNSPALAGSGSGVINLDQPGTYLHWTIFTVSVANLVLIAVMVVIFGVALLLPFPRAAPTRRRRSCRRGPIRARSPALPAPGRGRADLGEDEDARHVDVAAAAAGACGCCRRASCCPTASPPTWPPGCTCSAWPAWPRSAW